MLPRCFRVPAIVALLALVAGCSSTAPTGTGSAGGSGSFTATVGGSSFNATASTISVTASKIVPGGLVILGTQLSGNNETTLNIDVGWITGTGMYPLGTDGVTTPGGLAGVVTGTISPLTSKNWGTPTTGAAGQFIITKLTSTEIAGTFQFTATPSTGPNAGTGNEPVTNGKFDLTLPSTFTPASVPGSSITGTFGSLGDFTAAVVEGEYLSSTNFEVLGTNDSTSVSISTSVPVAVNTTYPLGPSGVGISVVVTQGANSWGGTSSDSGTVTITTLTSNRIAGSFTGKLVGPSTLTITNGQFSFIPR